MQSAWESFIRNPFSAGSLLVALFVLLVFQWWRQKKEFCYRVISDYPLFDVNKQFSDRVKILFDNKQVNRVSLVVIQLLNTGWQSIKASDFYTSVGVNFGDKAEIMDIQAIESRPKELSRTLNAVILDSTMTIEPTLFNRGDFVYLKILVHDYKGAIDVTGRIEGVPEIKRMSPVFGTKRRILFHLILAGVILLFTILRAETIWDKLVAAVIYLLFALATDYAMRNTNPPRLRIYDD